MFKSQFKLFKLQKEDIDLVESKILFLNDLNDELKKKVSNLSPNEEDFECDFLD